MGTDPGRLLEVREGIGRTVETVVPRLPRRPSRPGREGKLQHQGDRYLGLCQQHRARFEDGGAVVARPGGTVPRRLGRIEPAHHADRGVGDDPPLDFDAVCWAPIRITPSEPTLGDVQKDLPDRAGAFSRGVFVQLVENEKQQFVGLTALSLSSKACRIATPTTNRLARSLRLCRSTT